jgi:hypothetical protein
LMRGDFIEIVSPFNSFPADSAEHQPARPAK